MTIHVHILIWIVCIPTLVVTSCPSLNISTVGSTKSVYRRWDQSCTTTSKRSTCFILQRLFSAPEKALRRLWPFAEKWCLVRQKGKSWKTTFSVFPAWFYFAQHGSWKQKMALEYGTYEQLQVWWEMGKSEDQSLELRIHFQSQTAQSNDCNFRGWGCWKSRWTRENQVEVLST